MLYQISKSIPDTTFITKAMAMSSRALATPLIEYLHEMHAYGSGEAIDLVFGKGTWKHTIDFRKSLAASKDVFKGLFAYFLLYGIPEDIASEIRLGFNNRMFFIYPFLDYDLIQSSLKLPIHLLYHYTTKKAILKRYCLNFFSREFVYKPKEGFGVPFAQWFTSKEFEPFLKMPLEGRSLRRGWWSERELKKVLDTHKSGNGTDSSAESIPWITANLELWMRICIEGDSPDLFN